MATQLPNKADITGAGVVQGGVKTALNQWIDHSSEVDNQVKAITGKGSWDLAPIMSIEAIKTALDNLQSQIVTSGGDAPPGTANYIANGLTFKTDGLNLKVQPGRATISEKNQKLLAEATLALSARSANLVYGKLATSGPMTVGAVQAAYPEPDDNTVAQWRFNLNGDQVVPNYAVGKSAIAVANNLVNNGGLTRVDGWCDYAVKGDGTSGYYVSQNSTGFPTGAAEREISLLFTCNKITGAAEAICGYGTDSSNLVLWNSSGQIRIFFSSSAYTDTSYYMEQGKSYLITFQCTGSTITVLVNGTFVYSYSTTLTTTAGNITVLRWPTSAVQHSNGAIHFLEIRNKARSNEQIAQIANKLCLPCTYTKTAAQYPTIAASDLSTAYHEWKFDETSGTAVADSAGALNGTATGTTIVDSELGLGKARRFNGSTSEKIETAAYVLPQEHTFIAVVNPKAWNGTLWDNRNTSGTGNVFFLDANGLYSPLGGAGKTQLPIGTTSFIAHTIKNGALSIFYNGVLDTAVSGTIGINTISQAVRIGLNCNSGVPFNGTVEYMLIIPRALSQAEIAQYYNALMTVGRKDIREILPSDAISLGFARTSSTAVLEIVDASNPAGSTPDWAYGVRVGVNGIHNRRKFLGWKYFNTGGTTSATLQWQNPFGTRRLNQIHRWSIDANATNESPAADYFANTDGPFGAMKAGVASNVLTAVVGAKGVAYVNSVWQTSGYLGCYAEVLEDVV